ncbi:putative fruit-body specific protein a [Lyophyllum shimeji]|uniref:Fruit-body specific protein a n=1 Tax=Lyophyllum shimeji TaxID=47721 RepID=A0A9P3UL96_LYOSH|nr:putative fruit-body specific protein a [Lyophyllum shimeji]
MRLLSLFSVLAVVILAVVANPLTINIDLSSVLEVDLSDGNRYGAPNAPWSANAHPGWYYGIHPESHRHLRCLRGWICKLLWFFPHVLQCPKPPHIPPKPPADGYTQTFANLTGATQASDYLTFGLVDTIAGCKTMCNSVNGCKFVNTYHDVNGKDGSTQLTCSLFSNCHNSSDATNTGGQTQPDGSIDFIRNSDGWCKQ